MFKKALLALGVVGLVVVAFFAGTSVVHPAKASSTFSFGGKTYPTYVVHGIPGVPVDVYVNKKLTIPNFQPGTTAGPFSLPADFYTISLYAVGANPTTAAPIVSTPVGIQSSIAPVSVVARLDRRGKPALQAIVESNDFVLIPGEGMVAIRDASTNDSSFLQGCVDPVGITSNFFPTVGPFGQYFRAGQYTVRIFDFGATDCSSKPLLTTVITVQQGVNLNIYVVGDKIAGTFQLVVSAIQDEGNNR